MLLSLGCVSKESYTQVVAERDGLSQQLQSRTTERDNALRDLAAARTEATRVQGELDTAKANLVTANQREATLQTDLTRTQTDLSATKQTYDTLKTRADKAQKYANVAEGFFRLSVAGLRENDAAAIAAFTQMVVAITATADQPLKDAWDRYAAKAGSGAPDEEQILTEFMELLAQRLPETK